MGVRVRFSPEEGGKITEQGIHNDVLLSVCGTAAFGPYTCTRGAGGSRGARAGL